MNKQELEVAKFAILTFCKGNNKILVRIQVDNQTALAYLIKWEKQILIQEAQEMQDVCFYQQITLTVEYFPEVKNTETDQASTEVQKLSRKWILDKIVKELG